MNAVNASESQYLACQNQHRNLHAVALSPYFVASLERAIEPHNRKAYDRKCRPLRDCSTETRLHRKTDLKTIFGELVRLGFQLREPSNLKEKHIHALVDHWVNTLSPHSIHRKMSTLRLFSTWIGKRGLVADIETYVVDKSLVKRQRVASSDKSWEGRGIDVNQMIENARLVDERFACMLTLEHQFGLRAKESILLRPHASSLSEIGVLELTRGTKGGRSRLIAIRTDEQREAIDWAKSLVTTLNGSLAWTGLSWKQAQRRYYYLMQKIGATKSCLGVTGHGLRAGFSHRELQRKTGVDAPVKGGSVLRIRNLHEFDLARLHVSLSMGHGRIDVTNSYYGSFGHALRPLRQAAKLGFACDSTLSNVSQRPPC